MKLKSIFAHGICFAFASKETGIRMKVFQYIGKVCSYLGWVFFGAFVVPIIAVITLAFIAFSSSSHVEDRGITSFGSGKGNEVGVIELLGEISDSSHFLKLINSAAKSDNLKALVVRIDSPGGTVGAAEEMYRAIKEADKLKPVVCSLGNMAASGGLYAAVACRKIVANRGTLSGSIGVIMMMPNFQEVMDRFGLRMNVIKSGQYKDSGSPYRAYTEADRQILQSVVDNAYKQFVDVVASSRGLDREVVKKFADGRIIIGEEAHSLGIVDEFGGVPEAAKLALTLAGTPGEPEIVPIKKRESLKDLFEEIRVSAGVSFLRQYGSPQLLYRAEF